MFPAFCSLYIIISKTYVALFWEEPSLILGNMLLLAFLHVLGNIKTACCFCGRAGPCMKVWPRMNSWLASTCPLSSLMCLSLKRWRSSKKCSREPPSKVNAQHYRCWHHSWPTKPIPKEHIATLDTTAATMIRRRVLQRTHPSQQSMVANRYMEHFEQLELSFT